MIKKLFNSPVFNSWFSSFINLGSSLIAIPIVLRKLNVEEINLWFLIMSILAIGQGVQFGFNSTFIRFISYVNSGVRITEIRNLRDKKELDFQKDLNSIELSRVFYLMKNTYMFLSIFYLLALLLFGYLSLLIPINKLENPSEGWIAFCIIASSSFLTLSFGYYQNFMLGINKVALVQRIMGLVSFVGLFFIIGILYFSPSLISIVLVYQIVSLTLLICIIYFAKNEIKKRAIKKVLNSFDKELFSVVWESTWKSGITSVMANIVKHISAIIVSQFFSPAVSASFLFTKRIFDIIERFTMTTFNARLPMIAKYRGRADFNKLIPLLVKTQRLSYVIFIVCYLTFLIGGEYILSFISSNVNIGSFSLVILFSLSTFMSRWGGMTLSISNQSNHVVEHISTIVVSIVFFSIVFLAYDILGIEVFPFAGAISMMFAAFFISKYTYKNLNTTFLKYEKRVFIPFFGLLLIINLIYYLDNI